MNPFENNQNEQHFDQVFKNIPEISPSEVWKTRVLSQVGHQQKRNYSFNRGITIMLILIVLLNVGFLLTVALPKQEQTDNSKEYQSVASELLLTNSTYN